jgi:DNA-binding protein HU-beta
MRKQDLIDAVAAEQNLPKRQVGMVVDAVFNAIRDAMAQGEKVTLTGFGSFEVVHRNEREGRNPRTGKTITIAARKAPQFRAGSELKRAVSGDEGGDDDEE